MKTGNTTTKSSAVQNSFGAAANGGVVTRKPNGRAEEKKKLQEIRQRVVASNTRGVNAWQYKADGTRKTFGELTTPEVLTWIGTLPESERQEAARQFETEYLKNPGSVRYDPYYTQYSNNQEARDYFGTDTFDQEWIDANVGYRKYLDFTDEKYTTPKAPGKNATEQEKAAYLYWQIANTYEATTQAAEEEYARLRQEVQDTVRARQAAGEEVTADEIIAGIDWEEEYETLLNLREAAKAGNGRMLNRPVQVGEASIRSMVLAAIRGEDVTEDRDFLWDESQYIGRGGYAAKAEEEEEEAAAIAGGGELAAGDGAADEEDLPLWQKIVSAGQEQAISDSEKDKIALRLRLDTLQRAIAGQMPDEQRSAYEQEILEIERQLYGEEQSFQPVAQQPAAQEDEQEEKYSLNNPEAEEKKAATYAEQVEKYREENTLGVTIAKVRTDIGQLQMALSYDTGGDDRRAFQELLSEAQTELNRLEDEEKQRKEIEEKVIAEVEEEIGEPEFAREWVYKLAQKSVLNSAANVPTEDYEAYLRDHMGKGTGQNAQMDKYDYQPGKNAAADRASLIVKGIAEGMDRAATATTEAMEYVMYTLARKAPWNAGKSQQEIYASYRPLAALRSWNAQFDREWMPEESASELTEQYPAFSFVSQGVSSMLEMMGIVAGLPIAVPGMGVPGLRINKLGPWTYDSEGLPQMLEMLGTLRAGGIGARLIGYLGRGAQNYVPFALSQYADGYEMAIEEGATEDQAAIAGALIGTTQGLLSSGAVAGMKKLGGGLARLAVSRFGTRAMQQGAVTAAKSGLGNAIMALAKTYGAAMLEEGAEEAAEEVISSGVAKMVYDPDRPWTGEDGVLNWAKMAESGLAGAVGGVMFTTMAGLSGMSGEAARAESERILQKFREGKDLNKKEIKRLKEIVSRNAAIEDAAAQIEAEYAAETEAADKAAETKREAAEKDRKAADAAKAKTKEEAAAAKPVIDAINGGTASYQDAETVRKIGEHSKRIKAAKEQETAAAEKANASEEEAQRAEGEAAATHERVRERARSEAAAQVDEEISTEREEAAREAQEAEAAKEEARKKALTEEIQPGVKMVTDAKLDEDQQGQMKVLDALAKRYGLEIDVADSLGGMNAKYGGGRRIVVALDALDNAYVQAGAHEMVHYVKATDEGDYRALEAIVLEELKKNEDFDLEREIAERIEQYEGVQELTRDQAIEEIVAEAVPTVFTSEEAMRALVQRNPSLVQRIRDWFVQFAKRLRDIALDYAADNNRGEIMALTDKSDSLMEIAYALDDAMMSARGRNAGDAEGEAKFSVSGYGPNQPTEGDGTYTSFRTGAEAQANAEEMRLDVDTDEFREWFKDSKVVDEKGDPKIMYHGTSGSGFTQFDTYGSNYGLMGTGSYFTDNPEIAESYTKKGKGKTPGVYPVYLSIQKPADMDKKITAEEAKRWSDYFGEYVLKGEIRAGQTREDALRAVETGFRQEGMTKDEAGDYVVQFLEEQGYDGITHTGGGRHAKSDGTKHRVYIAFEPEQVKSATGNNGDFDAGNADIRYSANNEGAGQDGEARQDEDKIREQAIMASGEARQEDTQESVNKIAGAAVREYKSTVHRAAVIDGLNEMIGQYAEKGDTEAAEAIADRVAKEIVESSYKTDISHREGYEAIRKRLREKGVSLTDTQKQEVESWYGSYEAWRRSMMGNVKIKKGAASLDAVWSELSDAHPEMFPPDTQEAEMPEVLNRFVIQMRPKYLNAYGMDRTGVIAELSLKLQGEVLKAIGKNDEAEEVIRVADRLRTSYIEENNRRLDEEREKRVAAYRAMGQELIAARERGDEKAYRAAIEKYRETRTQSIRMLQGANALAIGEQVRAVRKEQRRIGKIVAALNDQIEAENAETSRERMIEERDMYKGMLDRLNENARYLHRMQAIARAGMEPETDPELIEAEAALERMLNEDMAEELEDHGAAEVREKIQKFSEAMKAKQKDYGVVSTLTQKDVEDFFSDLEGEMVMQSEMGDIWRQRRETAEAEKAADDAELKALREQLRQAERLGFQPDVTDIKAKIADCQDRIAVSESRIKQATAQEAYAKRCGALSVGQAMRQGKIPQPVMERIVSMCIDAGRRGRFNKNALVQTADRPRLTWTTINRTFDDYFGIAAPIMRGVYIDPYMDNETAKVRWENEWTKRIKGLNLSQEESEIVQKVGERRNTLEELTEGMSAGQVARIQDAINVFREFYDDAYARAERVLKRNGFEMGHIKGYFPHMDLTQSWLEKIGVRIREYSLPTSINGLTENFTPKHKYSGHLEHRKGKTTDYDAVAGFNEYMKSMGDVIFHTDDIQRVRQFENEVRAAARSGVFGPGTDGHESTHMSEFVKHLHEIGNIWAGKKSSADRGKEDEQGRPTYAILDWFRRQRGASAVMGNLSSAITNTAPVTVAFAEHPWDALVACAQMLRGVGNGRKGVPESQFKIRRFGHDDPASGVYDYLKRQWAKGEAETTFVRKTKRGLENTAGGLFDLIDLFATNVVVNTLYHRNRRIGMDPERAMRRADDQAARRMGERNKGYMPTIYASKSRGMLTQFQFEPANLSQWLRKDLIREHGGLRTGAVMVTMSILGHILNELLERLTGKRPNIDPYEIGKNMYDTWKEEGEILPVIQTGLNDASEIFPYVGNARTPAALQAPLELVEAFMEKGSTPEKIGYALGEAAMAFVPGSNQIRKSAQGYQAIKAGGHYSASGKKLYYPLDQTPATWAQALAFGKSATHEAQAYYAGEADALTEAQTRAFRANVERGMSPTEAYRNAIAVRDADRLMDDASQAEKYAEDTALRAQADGVEPKEYSGPDVSEVPGLREEAEKTREGAIPNELTDRWYEKRDEPAVSNAILLWRMTGDKNALPIEYTKETKWSVGYLGETLAKQANVLYEEGFRRIMTGANIGSMTDSQAEELIGQLKDLKKDIDDQMKAEIKERKG